MTKPTHNTPNLIADDDQQTPFYDQLVSATTKINLFVTRQPAATWIVATLFAINCVFLFTATIHMSDTDTWYHLAGGRHFFETWQTSNPFDHSYLPEVNEFHNYFWGVQVLLYPVSVCAGYIGGISTKAILVLMAGYVLMWIITRDQPIIEASFSQLIVVAPAFGQGAYGSANASV